LPTEYIVKFFSYILTIDILFTLFTWLCTIFTAIFRYAHINVTVDRI